jgi:hypothetical protein
MKPLSERDSAVLAQHEAGATLQEIAMALGLKYATVRRVVEHVGPIHAKGREMLAADPESLEGLRLTGGVSERVYSAIANATYKIDVPDMERLSDIAAQGRECVARFPGVGPGVMAELDTILASFGIVWNPRPRPFAYRTKENRHPLMKSWDDDRRRAEQEEKRSEYWHDILGRVAQIERDLGTAALENCEGRDSMQGVALRLAFLSGYLGAKEKVDRGMRDITPEAEDDGGYETDGNLICLPGVSLSNVRQPAEDRREGGPS